MGRPVLADAHNVRHKMLSVCIHGDYALAPVKMLLHMAERGFKRRALTAVFCVVQHGGLRFERFKQRRPVCVAAVVDDNYGIIRVRPQFLHQSDKLFVRLVGRYDDDQPLFLRS